MKKSEIEKDYVLLRELVGWALMIGLLALVAWMVWSAATAII